MTYDLVSPRPLRQLLPLVGLLALALCHLPQAGCGGDKAGTDDTGAAALRRTVRGRLLGSDGQPLTGAQVALPGTVAAITGADGTFAVEAGVEPGGSRLFTAGAAGYNTVFRPLRWTTSSVVDLGDLPLRPVQVSKAVALPAAGADAATVEAVQGSQKLTLTLAAGDLVTAAGDPVTGSVDVELTYWHPLDSLVNAPALLVAQDANEGAVALETFGMAGVEVRQNGQRLSVAPGRTVTLSFTQLPEHLPRWDGTDPHLYTVDEASGLWASLGGRGEGALTLDAQGVVHARLPHFSYWNLDGSIRPGGGGCVTGMAYDACHPTQPLTNHKVEMWFLSNEQVKNFRGRTDGQGRFCLPTYLSDYQIAYNQKHGESSVVVNYLVFGERIDDTTMCNPLPQSCRSCRPEWQNFADTQDGQITSFCNRCQLIIPNVPPVQDSYFDEKEPPTPYPDTCKPSTPQVAIAPCTFCSGDVNTPGTCTSPGSNGVVKRGACSELQPTFLRGAGCNCALTGQACSVQSDCCPGPQGQPCTCSQTSRTCQPCTTTDKPGSLCQPDLGCCAAYGEPPLVCGDGVCILASKLQ